MPNVPALSKTWQVIPNILFANTGSVTNDTRAALVRVIGFLLGTESEGGYSITANPFVCKGSCNGTTSAMDGQNRILTAADVAVATTVGAAKFWIVLRNAVSGAEYCLHGFANNVSSPGAVIGIVMSPAAGFTGGSTTVRPDATDTVSMDAGISAVSPSSSSSLNWLYSYTTFNSGVQVRMHIFHSTDGKETRVVTCINSIARGCWIFSSGGVNSPTLLEWSTQNIGAINMVAASSFGGVSGWFNTVGGRFYGKRNGTNIQMSLTGEGPNTGLLVGLIPNKTNIRNGFFVQPLGLYCTTATLQEQMGQIPDWWITSASFADGDTLPNPADPSPKQFVVLGQYVFPWGTSLPNPQIL